MGRTSDRTKHLAKLPLFQPEIEEGIDDIRRSDISYLRAQAVARCYELTEDDVMNLSQKFWDMAVDNVLAIEPSIAAILGIHYNLGAGTLIPWARKRRELQPLMQRIMRFDVNLQFMMTEVAHGLNIIEAETTATMNSDGSFDLHTPHKGAAKFMPPSGPIATIGMERVAIVIARLMVGGQDRGVRPFLVPISDGKKMCRGVRSLFLPTRPGTSPFANAMTTFDHVHLPAAACLGSTAKPPSRRLAFLQAIHRVSVGSISIGASAMPGIGVVAHVVARYSQRRMVHSTETGHPIPIISFRTQQIPILHALAQRLVMESFLDLKTSHVLRIFCNPRTDFAVRLGIAAAAKTAFTLHNKKSILELVERCGAQGLFKHNQIIQVFLELRGASIAEGDTFVLGIRLGSELIADRYELPPPRYPNSWAARYERGLLDDCRAIFKDELNGQHRSEGFSRKLLPRCPAIAQAIGMRMFFEAAVNAGLDRKITNLYEAGILIHDPAWFIAHGCLTAKQIQEFEEAAVTAALPDLEKWLALGESEAYCTARMLTADRWDKFTDTFTSFTGDGDLHTSVYGRIHARL